MIMPARFEGITMGYAPGTLPAERYDVEREHRFGEYLLSIVQPDELERLLAEDFLHIDGALVLDDEQPPVVQHVSATEGKPSFIHIFREMVNRRIKPAGTVRGVWIPENDYAPIAAQVAEQLPSGIVMRGGLVAVGAVRLPYVLRPENEGGEPLDFPPPFHHLLREGESPFEPIAATGNRDDDYHEVNVIQAVYGTETGHITGRVGLVWDDDRAVPLAVHRQVEARRAGTPLVAASPLRVAGHLAYHNRP
jgi:hypothetical protein